jgi:hypothetical protein
MLNIPRTNYDNIGGFSVLHTIMIPSTYKFLNIDYYENLLIRHISLT